MPWKYTINIIFFIILWLCLFQKISHPPSVTDSYATAEISHNVSLWIDCTIWQSQYHQDLCHYYHTTLERNKYAKKLTSADVQCHCILLGIRILNLNQNDVFNASIQTHWKLRLETLMDQFLRWNYRKNIAIYKRFNNYVAWEALILAKCAFISWSIHSKDVRKMMLYPTNIIIGKYFHIYFNKISIKFYFQ